MTKQHKPYSDKKFKNVFGMSKQQFVDAFKSAYESTTMTTIGTLYPKNFKMKKKEKQVCKHKVSCVKTEEVRVL